MEAHLMELFNMVLEKWGLKAAIVVFLLKTVWELVIGSTKKYISAINANTVATNKLTLRVDKLSEDLQVAFFNIKSIKKGKLEMPSERDQ